MNKEKINVIFKKNVRFHRHFIDLKALNHKLDARL